LSLTGGVNWLLFFPLICVYVVLVHFGSLFRFTAEETSRGPSTFIVVALIMLGLGRVIRAFTTEKFIFWTLAALIMYLVMLAAFTPDPSAALWQPIELGGYVLLGAAISRTEWSRSRLSILWLLMAGALFISSFLTIVDYAGIIDVPYNNDATTSTATAGLEVWQASGFFVRRSGMAAIFGLTIAGSLALALAHESPLTRLYHFAAAAAGLLCLFLTHNRSGVLSAIAVIGVYTLVSPRFQGSRRINILLGAAVAGVFLLAVVIAFFPEHLVVYVAKLGFIGLADETWASDAYRLKLFIAAIQGVGENPLGNGFTKIPLKGGLLMNPHNMVTAIIWASGLFSFFWLPTFAAAVCTSFSRRFTSPRKRPHAPPESDAIACALFAWLLNGMTHGMIFTGLAWVLFGLMLSIRYFSDPLPTDPETGKGTMQHPFG
jgi:hypothetical protein